MIIYSCHICTNIITFIKLTSLLLLGVGLLVGNMHAHMYLK
jgi:hypothetical protein